MHKTCIAAAGAANFGQAHVKVARHRPTCTQLNSVDPVAAAMDVAARAGVPLFSSIEAFLTQDRPDDQILATPKHLHIPQVLQGVAARRRNLLNKPIAMTVAKGGQQAQLGRLVGGMGRLIFFKPDHCTGTNGASPRPSSKPHAPAAASTCPLHQPGPRRHQVSPATPHQ